ncbi:DUF2934 domain-containing protein [Faunimonas sp. B44]|uniref:DUF2934 domain-containing protein n=1 Tax=Faunimonas sp. B44 TaxID=3461493 RepID=UPI004043D882
MTFTLVIARRILDSTNAQRALDLPTCLPGMMERELPMRIANVVHSCGELVRVSKAAEKLLVEFPEASKESICLAIIRAALASGRGVELEGISEDGGRWPSPSLMEALRRRAYELWEQEGRPSNREEDHWLGAEQELLRVSRRSYF